MVSATRWRQDSMSLPTNPYQRLRWYPTFPGSGGYSTFGWSPVPVGDALRVRESPAGFIDGSGLSGSRVRLLGAAGLPTMSAIAKAAGAVAGIWAGFWLARKNLE